MRISVGRLGESKSRFRIFSLIYRKLTARLKFLQALERRIKAKYEASRSISNSKVAPIIIYQMGKVGSTTIYESIKELPLSPPVLHLHFLSEDLTEHRITHAKAGVYPLPEHLYLGESVRKIIIKRGDLPIKIISLVRDPIGHAISSIFQNPFFAKHSIQTDSGIIDERKATDYIENMLSDKNAFSYAYEWFDRELKKVFGIDVFSEPFPVDKGYGKYSRGNVDVLVLRMEDLSEVGPLAIQEFLGLSMPLVLKRSNVRSVSEDGDVYRSVRNNISISPAVCDRVYSGKFVNHFYSKAMIDAFKSKWS